MNGGFLTVSQLNGYIKGMFESDDVLSGISVSGEISNIKYHASGHVYFTLKDEAAAINAVMFRSDLSRLTFRAENGMRVIAAGRVSVYERSGQYQLYVSHMRPDGLGQLYMMLEALKKKLAAEGLFDPSRKKKLPTFPKRIGVVTSSTGAVIKDIVKVATRRYQLAEIVLFPVHVQGDEAVPEICAGIEYFNIEKNVDVMIVGRGGGSVEDLWAFNSEAVARAVAASDIPIISAVGHQSDFTVCDMVADVTAGTPSMAAELAVPDMVQVKDMLDRDKMLMCRAMQKLIDEKRMYLDDRWNVIELNSPKNRLKQMAISLAASEDKLISLVKMALSRGENALGEAAAGLAALNPLAVLSRGYGYVQSDDGRVLCRAADINAGDRIKITMADGTVDATAEAVSLNKEV